MGNLKVQGHLLVEASNHSHGGLRVINTQTAVAEASVSFWQAGECSWGIGAGCYAAGSLFTICSTAADRNLLTMDPETGNTYLYGNLKIRRLDKNTAPTAFMTFINNDSANGMAYSLLEDVTVTKTGGGASGTWNIGITGNAATATTATKANYPKGFDGKCNDSTWGAVSSNDYTFITGWYAGSGNYGAVDFLQYPTATQVTMKLDGFVYQNEGQYRVLDTSGGIISNSIGYNNHDGILKIVNTNTASIAYHSPLRIMSAAKGTQCLMLGPSNGEKNAGYLGFYNTGTSGSNSNYLTLGLYALDNAINIFGSGNIGFWSTTPGAPFSFYSKHNKSTGNVADFWSNFSDASFIYFGGEGSTAYKASVGYFKGLACLANEATYSRIGVADSGKPQYWTNSTSGKYDLVVGSGYSNTGPIKLTPGAGINNAGNNYISAGRGYSTGSGLNGIKIVVTEQDDAVSGIGQDCMGKAYELSVCAAQGVDNTAFITFCTHKIASPKSYSELGFFDGNANAFKLNGLFAVGTGSYGALSSRPAGSYVGQVYFAI